VEKTVRWKPLVAGSEFRLLTPNYRLRSGGSHLVAGGRRCAQRAEDQTRGFGAPGPTRNNGEKQIWRD